MTALVFVVVSRDHFERAGAGGRLVKDGTSDGKKESIYRESGGIPLHSLQVLGVWVRDLPQLCRV